MFYISVAQMMKNISHDILKLKNPVKCISLFLESRPLPQVVPADLPNDSAVWELFETLGHIPVHFFPTTGKTSIHYAAMFIFLPCILAVMKCSASS